MIIDSLLRIHMLTWRASFSRCRSCTHWCSLTRFCSAQSSSSASRSCTYSSSVWMRVCASQSPSAITRTPECSNIFTDNNITVTAHHHLLRLNGHFPRETMTDSTLGFLPPLVPQENLRVQVARFFTGQMPFLSLKQQC